MKDRQLILALIETLPRLSFRERLIVKMRYGLDGNATYTLEEVGRQFRVTRERVRQVEMKAFGKIVQARKGAYGWIQPW
jgi:DNA-directed RNA polymerase sigma subunit (sigma70/sigma32)